MWYEQHVRGFSILSPQMIGCIELKESNCLLRKNEKVYGIVRQIVHYLKKDNHICISQGYKGLAYFYIFLVCLSQSRDR